MNEREYEKEVEVVVLQRRGKLDAEAALAILRAERPRRALRLGQMLDKGEWLWTIWEIPSMEYIPF